MMPDLGKYAGDVLLAYAVSILLVLCLILLCWMQSRAARSRLEDMESRVQDRG